MRVLSMYIVCTLNVVLDADKLAKFDRLCMRPVCLDINLLKPSRIEFVQDPARAAPPSPSPRGFQVHNDWRTHTEQHIQFCGGCPLNWQGG